MPAYTKGFVMNGTGLQGQYYSGQPALTNFVKSQVDPVINFSWQNNATPDPSITAPYFSIRWTGYIVALYSELYTFEVTSDDGSRLIIGGVTVFDHFDGNSSVYSGTLEMVAGDAVPIELDYQNVVPPDAQVVFRWSSASQAYQIVPESQLYTTAQVPVPSLAAQAILTGGVPGIYLTGH